MKNLARLDCGEHSRIFLRSKMNLKSLGQSSFPESGGENWLNRERV